MIEFYTPKQTSKVVSLSRWAVGWGVPIFMLSKFFEIPALHQWWAIFFPIPVAVACSWLATEGINRALLKTKWGREYLARLFSWAAAQRDYLKSRGESGNNVYLDSGDFASFFVVASALLITVLGILGFLFGGK